MMGPSQPLKITYRGKLTLLLLYESEAFIRGTVNHLLHALKLKKIMGVGVPRYGQYYSLFGVQGEGLATRIQGPD